MAENGTVNGTVPVGNAFRPVGTPALRQAGGYVREDLLPELSGPSGVRIFKQMRDESPIVGAILFACEMLLRPVGWTCTPADDSPQALELAAFAQHALFDDCRTSWTARLSDLLSMLPFGWAWVEWTLKRRQGYHRDPWRSSQASDGLLGFADMGLRSQDSLLHWEFDEHDEVQAMVQQPPFGGPVVTIPRAKSLLFRPVNAKGNPEGRALTLDTPVPTPDGWTTMGEIQVGDKVYDEQGKIRYVVAKSPVWTNRPVYEIEFASGHTLVADAQHLWLGTTYNDRTCGRPARVRTTQELYARLQEPTKSESFCLGLAPVLDAPLLPLPLDPYLLGYWLGDGSHVNGAITVEKDDLPSLVEQAEQAGFDVHFDGERSAYISGMKVVLRAVGVLQNKHIPLSYLRAHWTQRLALLQGLMDSDGTAYAGKDQASKWYNSNLLLVQQFCELVRSLGGRAHSRIHTAPGRICGTINGHTIIQKKTLYEVSMYMHHPMHRLPRKALRQSVKDSLRTRGHFVRAIRPGGTADTVCIEVDSPRHLFLAGEGMVPTHNSILRNAYRSWYFLNHITNIEGIGIERDLAGIPVVKVPIEITDPGASGPAKAAYEAFKDLATKLRQNEQAGVVFPLVYDQDGHELYKLELLSTAGRRQFDTGAVIQRHELRMAQSVLADMILIGHEQVGSYALASSKTNLFSSALGGYLHAIREVLQLEGLEVLWQVNGLPRELMPTLAHGDVEHVDMKELSEAIKNMAAAGFDVSDLDRPVRLKMGLPAPEEEALA